MRFELGAAVSITSGVVKRDAALPQSRRAVGNEPDQIVEAGRRFLDAAALEVGDRAVEDILWALPARLCREDGNESRDREGSRC